jgi:hypothetical protein
MNMTASPPATGRGKLNCDPLQKIAHLGEDAKADICSANTDVCFGPKADILNCASTAFIPRAIVLLGRAFFYFVAWSVISSSSFANAA